MKRLLFTVTVLLALAPGRASAQPEPTPEPTPALLSLVEAERSFARTSVAVGMRDAFYQFFAEDGVTFRPAPGRYREQYRSEAAPASPPPFRLDWKPVFADIARAGDLGYTTGPYVVEDLSPAARPPRHGYYCSIWQKQPDGAWKVRVDIGIQTPEAPPEEALTYRPAADLPVRVTDGAAPADVKALDRTLAKRVAEEGLSGAFAGASDAHSRLYVMSTPPVAGRDAIRAFLAADHRLLTLEPMDAGLSASSDLGFTYGRYTLAPREGDAGASEAGYYTHVWRRAAGAWVLAARVVNPERP